MIPTGSLFIAGKQVNRSHLTRNESKNAVNIHTSTQTDADLNTIDESVWVIMRTCLSQIKCTYTYIDIYVNEIDAIAFKKEKTKCYSYYNLNAYSGYFSGNRLHRKLSIIIII